MVLCYFFFAFFCFCCFFLLLLCVFRSHFGNHTEMCFWPLPVFSLLANTALPCFCRFQYFIIFFCTPLEECFRADIIYLSSVFVLKQQWGKRTQSKEYIPDPNSPPTPSTPPSLSTTFTSPRPRAPSLLSCKTQFFFVCRFVVF